MSKAAKQEAKRKRRAARHKRRVKARRAKKKRLRAQEPVHDPWPDTTGLSDEQAARVMGEFFFWEDYHERNPESTWAAPM